MKMQLSAITIASKIDPKTFYRFAIFDTLKQNLLPGEISMIIGRSAAGYMNAACVHCDGISHGCGL